MFIGLLKTYLGPVESDEGLHYLRPETAATGRRYRRQDEIGTPYCVTVDFDTLGDDAVTIREGDSMKQEREGLDAVEAWLGAGLPGC